MSEPTVMAREAAEDIFFGQVVIYWARWFLIGAGTVLVLWTAETETDMVVGVLPIIALLAMNFFLHGRQLAGKPPNPPLLVVSSVVDLLAITAVVILWTSDTGLNSQFFIMYYPVVLAFAFVMPPRVSIAYTVATIAAYTAICVASDPALFVDVDSVKILIIRLITLGAMGGLGTYYWRIQRDRRHSVDVRTLGSTLRYSED